MVVQQIIRNGGFDPEDVARLNAAFTAAWKQIECRYDLASDSIRVESWPIVEHMGDQMASRMHELLHALEAARLESLEALSEQGRLVSPAGR